jgi:hypothetical protein
MREKKDAKTKEKRQDNPEAEVKLQKRFDIQSLKDDIIKYEAFKLKFMEVISNIEKEIFEKLTSLVI